ncbi:nitroreductase family protein [Paenibacillus sinopodophylli]|uniref:nitroreductase family protein n=1 Tax=Paenibacillus sinopodophylli TaxID=1837342 RepID=UPI00110D20C8|nr:nitroreductase [Paenibacillus sinopodophylli]
MNKVIETIRMRRTIQDFDGRPLSKETLLALLDNAIWAPFHSKKEPWRFILFMGDGRRVFAEAVLNTRQPEFVAKHGAQMLEAYCSDTPAHLIVVMRADLPQKAWEEAFAATSALIQNIQLLAWEQGIGVVWKTSPYNESLVFLAAVGVSPEEKVVGTLHLGYFSPDAIPAPKPRTPASELLTIIED